MKVISALLNWIKLIYNNLGSTDFSPMYNLFKEAVERLSEEYGNQWDSTMQFRKDYAYFLFTKMKKPIEVYFD